MKKTLLTLIILFCGAAAAFALPGYTPFVPDTAGEYVYYRDYSFAHETYQIVGTEKRHFDEKEIVTETFKQILV